LSAVLVLDANQRSALSVTRSLGKHGVSVVCADESTSSLAGASKYCKAYEVYSEPSRVDLFISDINAIIERHDVKVLYPVTEVSVYTLLENQDRLNAVVLPFPDLSTVHSLSDKGALVKLCQKIGVHAPVSEHYKNGADFKLEQRQYSFPVVLKPMLSRIKAEDGGWIGTAVTYAHSKEELQSLISNTAYYRDHPFMIQEYIDGYGSGVFLLYSKGEYVAHFAHKRLREKPPSGGVSVLSESIDANPAQLDAAKKLLSSAGWHGVAMVEFKVNNKGVPYVIEVNPRFWGSLQLAVDSGVDFPKMLHQISTGEIPERNSEYTKGQKLRWFLGDLDRLYIVLKSREYSVGKKLISIVKFLIPWSRKMRYEVNRKGDLKPFWYELKNYL